MILCEDPALHGQIENGSTPGFSTLYLSFGGNLFNLF